MRAVVKLSRLCSPFKFVGFGATPQARTRGKREPTTVLDVRNFCGKEHQKGSLKNEVQFAALRNLPSRP